MLSEFNPYINSWDFIEWFGYAIDIKNELGVSDSIMIVKADESLNGRAVTVNCYCCEWRPIRRKWEEFSKISLLRLVSKNLQMNLHIMQQHYRDCSSLSDYRIRKFPPPPLECDFKYA
ncbi:hypothetical protein GWI33_000553 [Rhynchophorus ferrugineus]|uniref:Uncharacterized protein n=1 Tax=Rhynchophorus ferrugineus TaxID=354439 RepID=A0A834MKF2_RHYFE|nr:hypothetical protein GWI33_000553 [Rhynchophorus ferrugineus]